MCSLHRLFRITFFFEGLIMMRTAATAVHTGDIGNNEKFHFGGERIDGRIERHVTITSIGPELQITGYVDEHAKITSEGPVIFSGVVYDHMKLVCKKGVPIFEEYAGNYLDITCDGEPIFKKGMGHHIKVNGKYIPSPSDDISIVGARDVNVGAGGSSVVCVSAFGGYDPSTLASLSRRFGILAAPAPAPAAPALSVESKANVQNPADKPQDSDSNKKINLSKSTATIPTQPEVCAPGAPRFR